MKRITVPEEGIETLFGSYDENLKHLESRFNVRIRPRDTNCWSTAIHPASDKVDRVVGQLTSLMRDGYKLSNADVKTASDLVAQDTTVDLRDHFLKGSVTPAGKRRIRRRPSISAGISTRSISTTSCSASDPPAPARPISRWRRPSRFWWRRR